MTDKDLFKLLVQHSKFDLTDDQHHVLQSVATFLMQPEERIFVINGYAGTGKTTLIGIIANTLSALKKKLVLMAPTGRAAKVMTVHSGYKSTTIHKHIFRQASQTDLYGKFVLDFNKLKNGVFIVDEASMVNSGVQENTSFGSGDLLEDLIRFVFNSGENKLIFVGDIAQLPPVKQTLSPALNTDTLMRFFYPVETGNLTQVMRHKARSGIIRNATHIRQCLKSQSFDALKLTTSTDVLSISGNEIVERIEQSYDTVGVDETVIITRSNKAAVVYNKGIRQQVLWNENILDTGDSLVVVKNNYFWIDNSENTDFIANGDIIKVLEVNYYEELYGFRFADVVIGFTDYPDKEITVKILLESLESNTASLEYDKRKLLFEAVGKDYEHIRGRKKRYKAILDNPYFNALEVKYAYALTCHKAQGGQWKHVYIEQEGFNRQEEFDESYLRWLYTAFTRASETVFLVNFRDRFFDETQHQ